MPLWGKGTHFFVSSSYWTLPALNVMLMREKKYGGANIRAEARKQRLVARARPKCATSFCFSTIFSAAHYQCRSVKSCFVATRDLCLNEKLFAGALTFSVSMEIIKE